MQAHGHDMPIMIKQGSAATSEMRRWGFDPAIAGIGGKLNALAIARIAAEARRRRVELTQSTLSSASWWCGWLETFGGPKSIGHVQGFTSAFWHRRQTHLLANSGAVRDDLIRQGVPPEKITVLWNALDPADFLPERSPADVRAEFGADAATPVVGTFGHLSTKKGYRELFAAIPDVVQGHS